MSLVLVQSDSTGVKRNSVFTHIVLLQCYSNESFLPRANFSLASLIVVVRFSNRREYGVYMETFETLSTETSKLVYLYLRECGAATAKELRAALDIPLLKLLPVLGTLEDMSLVQRDSDYYDLVDPIN